MDHNVVEGDALTCNTIAMESPAVAEVYKEKECL
jgi:hypothetical protein